MINEKQTIKVSKFLSLVLRHQPEIIDIELDDNGWTDVQTLLEKLNQHGHPVDMTILKHVVDTNSKKRFAFNETFDRIRASQGHSVEVDLGYTPQKPPQLLFHGTTVGSVESILQQGIQKRDRHHVHLSKDLATALNVGQRHGKPYIFEVLAEQMYHDTHEFFVSENGVWLTNSVPAKYLRKHEG